MDTYTLWNYRHAAKASMSKEVWDYLEGGASDEFTLEQNRKVYQRAQIFPRLLTGAAEAKTGVNILGRDCEAPVILGPVSPLNLFHPNAEKAQVEAAQSFGTIAVISGHALTPIEETVEWGPGRWFQLYSAVSLDWSINLVQRAASAGSEAVVVTADAFHSATRDRNRRNNFKLPCGVGFGNYPGGPDGKDFRRADGSMQLLPLDWDDLSRLRDATHLPLILKGVLRKEDALRAAEVGFDGIIVSNHGGRQLDRTATALEALPPIAKVVRDRLEVFLDGGVMRGTDVLSAIALGAKAVLLGRAYVYGLSVAGAFGAADVLSILKTEFADALLQAGVESAGDLTESMVQSPNHFSTEYGDFR
ncbi:alpha-hydroxy acid oxidase [uncultured Ruegeria sp.]|uniref:alpha-hydroxy acid oxidase n=1 Tax=uncultured Ruegeria sp. TaxID=259304 RepID=UPI00261BCC20|nr:alpha-hydroxy acid oxidase [uncultured Ruegeria sp.]